MARVFWDTNLFIYLTEAKGQHVRVRSLREHMRARGDQLFTSALTLGELLVRPRAEGADELVRAYERLVTHSATVLPFDASSAHRFADIRAGALQHQGAGHRRPAIRTRSRPAP